MSSVLSLKSRRRKSREEVELLLPKNSAEWDAELAQMLDDSYRLLIESNNNDEHVGKALDAVFGGLERQRTNRPQEEWDACIRTCRAHPILPLIHQDPFTGRAFSKPRGYAGDAVMIDLIYRPEESWPLPEATPLGLDLYRYTSSAPAAAGVRARRGFIADLIDRTTLDKPRQEILAIAAGHLREASLTTAFRRKRIERFVALDSDPLSLQEVERSYGAYGVQTVPSPFSVLITNRLKVGQFDLIYSTGLFDYLNANTGRRLVSTMFDMLKPGGELVVANFLPGIRDVGYMEAFMDWKLIYRTRQDMVNLTMDIEEAELRDMTLFTEENRNIIFLRVGKK
jgi:SAM-dependent methyltransferase